VVVVKKPHRIGTFFDNHYMIKRLASSVCRRQRIVGWDAWGGFISEEAGNNVAEGKLCRS
jgi:hypothetical protein